MNKILFVASLVAFGLFTETPAHAGQQDGVHFECGQSGSATSCPE